MPGSTTPPDRLGTATVLTPGVWPSRFLNAVGIRKVLSKLNGWPALSPVNASTDPSRSSPHDSGPMRVTIPYIVGLLHPLLQAGSSRRTQK
jgi:hypothetical protein